MQHIIGQEPLDEALDQVDLSDETLLRTPVAFTREQHRSNWACTWSADGMSVACGPIRPRRPHEMSGDELMAARQQVAGEEDQTIPGCEHGA